MQLPSSVGQAKHLAKWASLRKSVFNHFKLNETGGSCFEGFFTEDDIDYSTKLFDLFSTKVDNLCGLT
jgi:hypothetical protein